MFIALAAVNAQERSDTTGTHNQTQQESSSSSTGKTYEWRDEDRELLGQDDLPSGLVETLKSDDYKGWENATIYRNKTSDEYMLVIQEGNDVKTFYFDKEGKSIENSPEGSGSSTGYQSGDSSMQSDTQTQTQSGTDTQTQTGTETQTQTGTEQTTGVPSDSTSGSSNTSSGSLNQDSSVSDQGTESSSSSTMSSDTTDHPTTGSQSSSSSSDQSMSTDQSSSGQSTSDQSSSTSTSDQSVSGTTGSTSSQDTELQSTDPSVNTNAWKTEDRVLIRTNDLPSSLLITLGDPMYRGWENSSVYRNRTTSEYMIEIRDGSDTRTYYFDKDGKAVVNTSGSSTDDDQ